MWTPSHGRAKARRPARTYIQQLSADMGCSLKDLPGAMDDREGWQRGPGRSVLMVRHDDDDDVICCIQILNKQKENQNKLIN